MKTNLLKNIPLSQAEVRRPKSINEVVAIVRNANRKRRSVNSGVTSKRRSIRPIGSAWSFSDCIYTEDVLLDMSNLNQLLGFVRTSRWHDGPSPVLRTGLRTELLTGDHYFVHAQAGATIESINIYLDRLDATMPTMGSSSGQTIAGAIATGTHGGHFDMPPIADFVRALLIIDSGGKLHWVERSGDQAITDPSRFPARPSIHESIEFHYDNNLFDACLVSVGGLGVVVEVILECRKQVLLSRVSQWMKWGDVRQWLAKWQLAEGSPLPPELTHPNIHTNIDGNEISVTPVPEAMEILLSPHRNDDNYTNPDATYGKRDCLVVSVARAEAPTDLQGEDYIIPGLSIDALGTALDIEAHGHGGLRRVARQVINTSRPDTNGYFKAHTVLSTYSGFTKPPKPNPNRVKPVPIDPGPGFTSEVVLPTENVQHLTYIDDFLQRFDQLHSIGKNMAGFLSIRFTKKTQALIGMQKFDKIETHGKNQGDLVCHIEFQGLKEFSLAPLTPVVLFPGGALNAAAFGFPLPDADIDHSGNFEGRTDDHFLAGERQVAIGTSKGKMHWGQFNRLNRLKVLIDYGDDYHKWREERTKLSGNGHYQIFSNSFTRRCGLESNEEAIIGTSWKNGRFDFFSLGKKGALRHAWGSAFNTKPTGIHWEILANGIEDGNYMVGPITATSWGPNRIDVFSVGLNGHLLQWWYNGSAHWTDLTASYPEVFPNSIEYAGPITVTSGGRGHLVLFALERGGNLRKFQYNGSWSGIQIENTLGNGRRIVGGLSSVAAAGIGRIDLFGIDNEANWMHWVNDGHDDEAHWKTTKVFHPFLATAPVAGSVTPGIIDAFAMDESGRIRNAQYNVLSEKWTSNKDIGYSQFPGNETHFEHPDALGEYLDDAYYRYKRQVGRQRFVGALSLVKGPLNTIGLIGPDSSGNVLTLSRSDHRLSWRWFDHGRGEQWD